MITETNGTEKRVIGLRTADGRRHFADLVIVAGMIVCLMKLM